ncbi:MAG: hypothetical protein A2V88_09755 [Elusimicrobia bacterium RBG_16_66_12]|nr:MAG: hypothetical protein A2V88_09755 [Elusimicrobia bacterium RBG_16_66_12]
MNDDLREKLSAYLDGALSEAERRDLESRLAASPDMRRELESLRAVSQAVKALPKSPLPAGYLARLQSRRARGGAERRDWVLLPPSYRPVAFALSSAVVAVAVWDQFNRTEAPISQVDLSGKITASDASSADLSAAPMTEEERSRRNEDYMAGLESEKRAIGISAVLPRRSTVGAARGASAFVGGDSNAPALVSSGSKGKHPSFGGSPAPEISAAKQPSPGERLDYSSGIPSDDAGLVFTDGSSLSSSWTLLGLPGNYPAVDYWSRRAVLLKRSRTKILEVRTAQDRVEVYFRLLNTGEASDPAKDRFATLPLEPKPVSLILLPR